LGIEKDNHMFTKEQLREFEADIASIYEQGKIYGPVHLSYGNEESLIEIFKEVHPSDWVFSTWRNHYHALLHGVPPEWLKEEVLAGRSMRVNNVDHRFFTSSIVGGTISHAVGVAKALQLTNSPEHVWSFIGDMALETGVCFESMKYAANFKLPITFVIEDNNLSTDTPTSETWNIDDAYKARFREYLKSIGVDFRYYTYTREKYGHHGIGKWIYF